MIDTRVMQEIEELQRRIAAEDDESTDVTRSMARRDSCRARSAVLTKGLACLLMDTFMGGKQSSPEQPMPIPNNHPASADLALARIRQRDAIGQERYRTRLTPFNGRDSLRDAAEEMADGLLYVENAIQEHDADKAEIAQLRAENAVLWERIHQFERNESDDETLFDE